MKKEDPKIPAPNVCVKCGQCMSVCPVFAQSSREWDTARGKLALIDAAGTGVVEGLAAEAVGRCLLCGACKDVCAAKVPTKEVIAGARARTREAGGERLDHRLQRELLTDNRAKGKLLRESARFFARLGARPADRFPGLYLRFPARAFMGRNVIPEIQKTSFLDRARAWENPDAEGPTVAFFVGCGAAHIFTGAAEAASLLMRRTGTRLLIPQGQACCGLAAHSAGDESTARKMAEQNLAVFSRLNPDYLITVCASCAGFIHEWPELFPQGDPRRDQALRLATAHRSAEAYLLENTTLARELSRLEPRDPKKVFLHTPCHARFGKARTQADRELLSCASPAITMVNPASAVQCCGHGGGFNLKHFDLSMDIFSGYQPKIDALSPDAAAAGCTGCQLQLLEGLSNPDRKNPPQVRHPLELIVEALG